MIVHDSNPQFKILYHRHLKRAQGCPVMPGERSGKLVKSPFTRFWSRGELLVWPNWMSCTQRRTCCEWELQGHWLHGLYHLKGPGPVCFLGIFMDIPRNLGHTKKKIRSTASIYLVLMFPDCQVAVGWLDLRTDFFHPQWSTLLRNFSGAVPVASSHHISSYFIIFHHSHSHRGCIMLIHHFYPNIQGSKYVKMPCEITV